MINVTYKGYTKMGMDAALKVVYIALAFVIGNSLSFTNLITLLFALTISHNALAFYYSGTRREYLTKNWRSHALPLAMVGVLIAFTMANDWPPVHFLFFIHHVFNECYLVQRHLPQQPRSLLLSRMVLSGVAFYSITRIDARYLPIFPMELWQAAVIFSGCLFVAALVWNRKKLPDGWITRDLLFEGSTLAVGLYGAFYRSLTLDHVLLYHFLLWQVYPLPKLSQGGMKPVLKYFGLATALMALSLPFTPLVLHIGNMDNDQLSYVIRLTSFFHFFTSFALSASHPMWIRRWFLPRQSLATPTRGQKAA